MQLKINDKSNQFWILDFDLPRLGYFDADSIKRTQERLVEKSRCSVQVGTSRPTLGEATPSATPNSWRGCALSVAMPQALRRRYFDYAQYKSGQAQSNDFG
ncbi:hypothetical protein [Nostoc sp.]|uniref:hypothetical protein n=1 Tax=Nostoc sp. TaxID=1180 RepID=UPI002FF4B111